MINKVVIFLIIFLFTSCSINHYKQNIRLSELTCAKYYKIKNFTDDPDVVFDDREAEIQAIIKRLFSPARYHEGVDIRQRAIEIYQERILSPKCHAFSDKLSPNSLKVNIYPIKEPWPHTQISKLSGLLLRPIETIDLRNRKVINENIDIGYAIKLQIVGTEKLIYYTIACADTPTPFHVVRPNQCK